ncbi:MAG: RnfH family protein [Ramlibacter sp.]
MIHVTVAWSPAARRTREWTLELDEGATVMAALQASGLSEAFPELDMAAVAVGVWGVGATLQSRLKDNDRLEVYRPLQVDPKLARRERFERQGSRAAGLFARKK